MLASIHKPTASRLKDYVNHIWEVDGFFNKHETILPQGTLEIIFNFSEEAIGMLPYSQTSIQAPRCFVQGMYTQVLQVTYTGRQHLLGISLHPHRIKELLQLQPAELSNTTVDLTLVSPVYNTLWHRLQEAADFTEKWTLLEAGLPVPGSAGCERSKTLSHLFLNDGTAAFQTVDELARQVCYSTRQLNRVVQDQYGVSAEELTTYKKYLQSVRLIHQDRCSLTQVAYGAGFYDQAHFCRVFKSYAGMTPNQYRKGKGVQPFHIFS
jgi:AraC-like DNA-binding protein